MSGRLKKSRFQFPEVAENQTFSTNVDSSTIKTKEFT